MYFESPCLFDAWVSIFSQPPKSPHYYCDMPALCLPLGGDSLINYIIGLLIIQFVRLARGYLIDLFDSYLACSLLQNVAVKLGLLECIYI